jgi:hypothetical protein
MGWPCGAMGWPCGGSGWPWGPKEGALGNAGCGGGGGGACFANGLWREEVTTGFTSGAGALGSGSGSSGGFARNSVSHFGQRMRAPPSGTLSFATR